MSKVAVLGAFEIHPEDLDAMKALAAAMAAETRKEPGCIEYRFGQDIGDPNRLLLSELWRDGKALAAHFQTPHLAAFVSGVRRLRLQRRCAVRYDVQDETDLLDR